MKNVLICKLFRPQAVNRAKLKGILLNKVKVLKAKIKKNTDTFSFFVGLELSSLLHVSKITLQKINCYTSNI